MELATNSLKSLLPYLQKRSYNDFVMEIRFDWNAEKAKRNLRKHGVSFKMASEVFLDPHVLIVEESEVDGRRAIRPSGERDRMIS